MESYFQKQTTANLIKDINDLKDVIECVLQEKNFGYSIKCEDVTKIPFSISSIIKLFKKQQVSGTISKKQTNMMESFSEIQKLVENIEVVSKDDKITSSLWNFLQGNQKELIKKINKRPGLVLSFEDSNQANFLLAKCQNLEKALKEIIRQRSSFANFIHWLSEDSFGTLDQIREEMDETYVAKRVSLPVVGKSTLDCILIMGHADHNSSSSENEKQTKFDTSKTTMIFCQPNAGYYEAMLQDSEWIDFYLENGLNVFLWNYRGFARSTGTPNPDLIRRDGESVVDYLRQELGVKKIGVHGQSLGGLVATHLAKHKGLDYLCADRTFSELANIAELTYGRIAGALYRLITWWTDDISNDFLESSCYKVMAFDSNDEVINPLGSLKHGVMSKLTERKLITTPEPAKPVLKDYYSFFSPLRFVASAQSFSYFIRKTLYSYNVNQRVNNHHPLLSNQEGMALFCACKRVSDLILNIMHETFASMPREPKLSSSRHSSFNSDKSKKNDLPEADQTSQSTGVESEASSPTKLLKKEMVLENENSNLQKSIKKKSYGHFLDENHSYGSRYIQEIIPDISPFFEDLEAGGVQLLDIMYIDDEFQYRFFRHFLQSFEIFGAVLPLDKIFNPDVKIPHSYQHNAISDVEIFIENIDRISKTIEQDPSSQTPNNILYLVLEDLKIINSILKSLSSNLHAKINYGASPRTSDSSPTVKISETNVDKDPAQSLGDRLIDIESHKGVLTLGHLVPLTCGHNGIPHYMELEVLKHHLKNSNLLKS